MECDNGLSESGTMDIVVTLPYTEAWSSDGGVLVSPAGGQHDEGSSESVAACSWAGRPGWLLDFPTFQQSHSDSGQHHTSEIHTDQKQLSVLFNMLQVHF